LSIRINAHRLWLQTDPKFGSRCYDLTKMLVFKDGGGGVVQLCMMWVCARCGKVFYSGRQFHAKPHAEAVVLDHFFTRNFAFVMGDRYVACSKPSCYCCKLYFKFHPLRAVTGRHHGNLWIQWGLPRPLSAISGRADRITLKILRQMSDEVRKDVLSVTLRGNSRQINMFDSTTGFSASRANLATKREQAR
jgi:hypothetical protein